MSQHQLSPLTRRHLLLGSAAVTTLGLTGCSGFVNSDDGDDGAGDDTGQGGGPISAYVSTEQATGLADLPTAFTEENGIEVEQTSAAVPDINQQLPVQLSSGTAADVFRVSPGYSSNVAAGVLGGNGSLLDLSESAWVGDIDDGTRAMSDVDGVTYALPVGRNSLVMAYNIEVFDELGLEVPTTWAELLDVCQVLLDAGRIPIAQGLAGGAIYLQFYVYALAGTLVYGPEPDLDDQMRAGDVDFANHPAWTEVFEKYLDLRDRDFFTPDALGVPPEQALQSLATGDSGMALMTNSGLPELYDYSEQGPEAFSIFAMPANDDAASTLMPTAPDFLAVNAEASNPEGARAFLDFLAQPENVEAYANSLGVLPGLTVGAEVTTPALEPIMPMVDDGRTVAYANYLWPNGDVQQTMLQSGQELYADQISIDELLTQMDADYDQGTP